MSKRIDVRFPSYGGEECGAWLYLPDAPDPAPVIVMGHGLGSVRTMRLDAYAERFAAAGYAVLVFDYRHFGDSDGSPRQLLDIDRQLADWRAAVRFARSRADVDTSKVVLWGTSFGGGHVLSIAADDPEVAAVIAQCPFTDGLSSSLAIRPLTSAKIITLAVADRIGSALGLKPLYVGTAGRAGSAALMTAADAEPGYLQLVPADGTGGFRNQVAARVALQIVRYRPGAKAGAIKAPVLFCVCDTDSVAPAKATLKHAAKAAHGEVRRYPQGHFDIYQGAAYEQVVRDQLDFLQRVVPTERGALT